MDSEPPPRRVSLRDIAKMMGVSHVTISLGLRNSPEISAKMKAEIQRVAAELGYRPDPMLNALSSYRQSKGNPAFQAVIGWVNAWKKPAELRGHEEFDAYWKGANSAAQKLGYRLEEFQVDKQITFPRLHQILSSRGIRSLLLPPHHELPQWGDFPWDKYYVVKFGRSLREPQTHLVTSDQALNTVLAFEKIEALGYRRIGFVTQEPYLRKHGHMFEAGFLVAQQALEPKQRLPILALVDMKPAEAVAPLTAWIKKQRPDAIYTDVPWILEVIDNAGFRVPEDFSLAATTLIDTGIDSGIDQHPTEIGRVGMLLLNSMINDNAIGTPSIFQQILIKGSWVSGTSMPAR